MLSARLIASASCLVLSSKRLHCLEVSAYSTQTTQWPNEEYMRNDSFQLKTTRLSNGLLLQTRAL